MYLYRPVIGAAHQSVFLATKGLDGVSARENLIVSQQIDWWNIQQKYQLSLLEFKEASRVSHAAGFANDKSIITSTIISGSGSFLCAKTVTLFHLQTASKTIVWTTVQQKISAKIKKNDSAMKFVPRLYQKSKPQLIAFFTVTVMKYDVRRATVMTRPLADYRLKVHCQICRIW